MSMLSRQQSQQRRKQVIKKVGKQSRARKKPAWDSTVSDLTVHQLSKEELELRRSRILSKNAEKAKRELEEIAKDARHLSSAASSHTSSAIGNTSGNVQEKELQSVLENSDRALAVVKDLFGDDPKRYTAQPNVTVAPRVITDRSALQRTLLESQPNGPTPSALNSPGGIRDVSVLGLAPAKPALNELPSPPSEFAIDESGLDDSSLLFPDQHSPPTPSSHPHSAYHPAVVDIPRFQKLVEQHWEPEVGKQRWEGGGESEEGGMKEEGAPQTTSSETRHTRGAVASGERHVLESEQLSSIAPTGSQQGDTTVESNLTSTDTETRAEMRDQATITGGKAEGSQPDHSQPPPPPPPHRQQHPLQIVHKMPLQTGKEGPLSHHTSSAASLARQQMSVCSGEVSRNQRVRKLPPGKAKGVQSSSKGIHDDLAVLQQLVQNLEQELQDYEQTSGYAFLVQKPTITQNGTFSSLTASLLSSVTKLTHYLKQSEIQMKGEVAVRSQLLSAMAEQQNLMDALTADVVKLQNENSSLKSSFQQLEQNTIQQAKRLEEDISELRAKLSSLEPIKEVPPAISVSSVPPPRSCSDSRPPVPPLSATTVASLATHTPITSHAPISSLLQTEDILPNSVPCVLPPSPPGVLALSSVSGAGPSGAEYLLTSLSVPPDSSLPLTHAHSVPSSVPSSFPATSSHHLHIPSRQHVLPHESTPVYPLYHTTGASGRKLPSFDLPFHPVPSSLSTTPLPSAGAVDLAAMSPSEFVGVSPPPLSVALQVPSLSSRPPLPPHSLSFQPSLPPNSLLSHPPLPQNSPSVRLSLPSNSPTSQPPMHTLPPSLPFSWKAPPQSPTADVMGGTTAVTPCSTPAAQSSTAPAHFVSSAFTTPSSSNVLVPPQQAVTTAVSLPDLSLTTMSLPVSETSTLREMSACSSSSSLDIEASLARMSCLARSVLEELAQDRGHLLRVPGPVHPHPLPTPPSTSVHIPHLPPVASATSMTSVTSLDSAASSTLQTSGESLALDSSSDLKNDSNLPESTAVLYPAGN